MRSDLIRETVDEYEKALQGEWKYDDERFHRVRKLVRDVAEELENEIVFRIESELAGRLAGAVADAAGSAIEAVLKGNEAEFRRWISADPRGYVGRGRNPVTGREETHLVIHGKLHDNGCIELRKRLVDAYPELLKTERILDLEDQVRSLVEQVNTLTARLEDANRRLRDEFA